MSKKPHFAKAAPLNDTMPIRRSKLEDTPKETPKPEVSSAELKQAIAENSKGNEKVKVEDEKDEKRKKLKIQDKVDDSATNS